MTKTKHWAIFSFLVLFAGAIWIWMSRVSPDEAALLDRRAPQKGFLAPEFTLQTLDGGVVSLSDLRGKAVLLNLWASWCAPCRAEMPAMQRVYEEYRGRGLEILAVNATNQDDLEAARSFVQQYGLTFPILLDLDGRVSEAYNLQALPSSFFIRPDGVIQEVVIGGPMAEALLRVRVEELLQELP